MTPQRLLRLACRSCSTAHTLHTRTLMRFGVFLAAFAVGALGGEAPTGFVGRDETYAVSHVADYGETPEGWQLPLRHCHGDCDTDADCDHHFFCFQRSADETVPGCPVMDGHAPKTGFDYCVKRDDHPDAPKLEDQTIASQTTHAPVNNFFAAKIADADWNPCTHLKCVVENHECTHGTHETQCRTSVPCNQCSQCSQIMHFSFGKSKSLSHRSALPHARSPGPTPSHAVSPIPLVCATILLYVELGLLAA